MELITATEKRTVKLKCPICNHRLMDFNLGENEEVRSFLMDDKAVAKIQIRCARCKNISGIIY